MSRRAVIGAIVVCVFLVPGSTLAAPITYDFTGTLTNSLNGNNAVTGTFTLDSDLAIVTAFSFTHPAGVFDSTNAVASVQQWTPATNPNTDFVGLSFNSTGIVSNRLWLRFQTSLSSFDGSTFYTGSIAVPGGSTGSELFCNPIPSATCSQFLASGFASGSATPAQAPVPEPASLALLGLGVAGIGVRRWRQRKAA